MTSNLSNLQISGIQELLVRIEKLEAENSHLKELFVRVCEGNSRLAQQVGDLLNQVGIMDLQIVELAEKVFPGYCQTQRQIMQICNPPRENDSTQS